MITEIQERNRSRLWIFLYLLIITLYIVGVFYYGVATQRPILGVLILFTFAPALLFLFFFYFLGNRDKITTNQLIYTNLIGLIFFIVAIIAESALILLYTVLYAIFFPADEEWLDGRYFVLLLFTGFVSFTVPAFVEETAKLLILHFSSIHTERKSLHPIGLVLFSLMGALVIATIENNEYIISSVNSFDEDTPKTNLIVVMLLQILLRNLLSVPLHGFTGILIGCKYSSFIHSSQPIWRNLHRILALPILIHGLFDWFLLWAFESLQHGGSPYFFLLLLSPFIIISFTLALVLKKWKEVKQIPFERQPRTTDIEMEMNFI